jgi:hypothetical protein
MKIRALFCVLFLAVSSALAQNNTSASGRNPIVIWLVGSPLTGETPRAEIPPDLLDSARQLGSSISVESFPAKGFADILFQAFNAHQEPDILSFDNFGVLNGYTSSSGSFVGINTSPAVARALVQVTNSLRGLTPIRGGWQYLLSTSQNYELAKLLALEPYGCDTKGVPPPPMPAELQPISVDLANAYFRQSPSLQASSDPDLLSIPAIRNGSLHVTRSVNCGYWGNSRFVFTALTTIFDTPQAIGETFVVLVLRKVDSQWRLLAVMPSSSPNTAFLNQTNITPLLLGPLTGPAPTAAQILSPPDTEYPAPAAGQRFGYFTWQRSSSPDLAFEVAEFTNQYETRLHIVAPQAATSFDLASPGLIDTPGQPSQLSAGLLDTTRGPWKWRIWSVSTSGAVTFTEPHTFQH